MPLILAVRNSPGQPGETAPPLRIERGEVVVGRGAGAGLLLSSPAVSRRHCTISGEGQAWRLVDSSTGGTFINGQRITGPHFLRHGEVIRVGDVEIAVMLDQMVMSAAGATPSAARDGWGRPAGGSTQVPESWAAPAAAPYPSAHQLPQQVTTSAGAAFDGVAILLQAAGLSRAQVGMPDQQVLAVAGAALRAALSGLTRLAQDRRKARNDLGLADSAAEAGGLAAAGSPEELLLRLLSLPPAQAAAQVGALGQAIDTHQRAVLAAMQESFHHALDQFSPKAIKTNARGEADAWKAYERAFEAKDGFVEVFAQALARHYGEAVREQSAG